VAVLFAKPEARMCCGSDDVKAVWRM